MHEYVLVDTRQSDVADSILGVYSTMEEALASVGLTVHDELEPHGLAIVMPDHPALRRNSRAVKVMHKPMSEREKLLDVLHRASQSLNMNSKINQNGRIKFSVHPYGETYGDTKEFLLREIAQGALSSDMADDREKDIPFSAGNLGILDFGYYFESKDGIYDIITEEEVDILSDSVADFLKEYGLIVHHDDGPDGFGHYKPWYVNGKTPISLDYGLDEINDLHPYSALRMEEFLR
jgi:phage tail protein X